MRWIFSLLFALTTTLSAFGQLARVQVIHNSPTPGTSSGPTVDIYVNGGLLPPLTAVAFRAATPFLDVPSGVALTIDVKVSPSTASDPAVFTANLQGLASGGKYVVMATGIVGNAAKPFGLLINDAAKEAASGASVVNLSVIHGAPDAPSVDVAARGIGTLIGDLQFNEIAAGLEVPAAKYYLDVKAAGTAPIVETFGADLTTLGGGAATVFASGLLANTPAFGLFAALPNGTVIAFPVERVAQIQVIHGSPEAGNVDVFAGTATLLPNFQPYDVAGYLFVPAETAIALAIAPVGVGINSAVWSATVTLPNGSIYQATALGDPTKNTFQVALNANGRTVSSDPTRLELNFIHGVAGGPEVSVATLFAGQLIDGSLSFGEYSNYAAFDFDPAFPIEIPLVVENGFGKILAAFILEVDDPADVAGLAGTVLVTPGQNGLLDALSISADGETGFLDRLPLAYVQLIHNSPAGQVSVWLDGDELIDTLDFRSATAFDAYAAGSLLEFEIRTLDGATSLGTFSPTLDEGKNYIVVVNGGAAGKPISFDVKTDARDRAADPTKVDVLVHHGSPDAPAVDVFEREAGALTTNLAFKSFAGYLSLPPADYFLDIKVAGATANVATFGAPLETFDGLALTVFASGQLSDGSFGLFAATAFGQVLELGRFAKVQLVHNSPSPAAIKVDVYANGALFLNDFEFRKATPMIWISSDETFDFAIAPATSTSVSQALATFSDIAFSSGKNYVVMAAGRLEDASFGLSLTDAAQDRASSATTVGVGFFHGSPSAPEVDITLPSGAILFDNVELKEFAPYQNVPAANYQINVTPANDNSTIVAAYLAPLSGLAGGAAMVFASGIFGGTPGFEPWVALTDGTTFPLQSTVSTGNLAENVAEFSLLPNPATDLATAIFEVKKADGAMTVTLFNALGQVVSSQNLGDQKGQITVDFDLAKLPAGVYQVVLQNAAGQMAKRLAVAR